MILLIQLIALLCGIGGIIGCFLPILPGPLLSLIGIFLIQRFTPQNRSITFLIVMTLLTVFSMISDYFLPLLGTKKYGGTKAGVRGSTIGLIIGFFLFPPVGLVIGPFLGAFLGERWIKKDSKHALRSARGSLIGSSLSTIIKLVVSILHTWFVIQAIR